MIIVFQKRKRDLEKENNPQPNTLNISNTRNTITSTATIGGDTLDKHQEQKEIETTNHEMKDTIVPKKENNPLLKMFEKIREKNVRLHFFIDKYDLNFDYSHLQIILGKFSG